MARLELPAEAPSTARATTSCRRRLLVPMVESRLFRGFILTLIVANAGAPLACITLTLVGARATKV